MTLATIAALAPFHGSIDRGIDLHTRNLITRPLLPKHYVITQQRDLSYRFQLHQHPFVTQLTKRLVRGGTSALQSADTDYGVGEVSLPNGVDVELQVKVDVPLLTGVKVFLLKATQATGIGGNAVTLNAREVFEVAAPTSATLIAGTRLVLADPMQHTPQPRSEYVPEANCLAAISTDTPIELLGATKLSRPAGDSVLIPGGMVILAAGENVNLVAGATLTVLRRRLRPGKGLYAEFFESYKPNNKVVQKPDPAEDLDFSSSGAYSAYNWELFFHVPLTVAMHLSKNQRFADAQRWFHFVFDPTDDSSGPAPERFWKVRPFQSSDVKQAEEILVNLATGADPALRQDTLNSIEAWRDAPFRPHVIARYRHQSYMLKSIMAYLDNLIAWGDSLYLQDTGEALDEATQLYVLAANILGPRPQSIPKKGGVRPQNYANLRQDLKQFGIVLRNMEADMLFDLTPGPSGTADSERLNAVRSMGKALYFCVPRNDKLLGYWDTVADRLFKIRNSLNLQGVFRQLPLFEPPIDPALLARAAAAGLDVGAVVRGLNQPLPLVRLQFWLSKSAELAQELKTIGNTLLSVMEKEDGESMAIMRAKQERVVLGTVEHVKYAQLQEAIKSKEGVLMTLALATQRYKYYEMQLGGNINDIESSIPKLEKLGLDRESLDNMKFTMQEPFIEPLGIDFDIAKDLGESGGHIVTNSELEGLTSSQSARDWQVRASAMATAASLSHYIPTAGGDFHFWGMGVHLEYGGQHIGPALTAISEYQRTLGAQDSYDASHAEKISTFQRREFDWKFQRNQAVGEMNQIYKQLRAAQIREAIADMEWNNHKNQIKNAEEIEYFLTGEKDETWTQKIDSVDKKTTNRAMYAWMRREAKGLYSQYFQFAFDIARKAERALQHELGQPDLRFLQFDYLAGKEGLLAGEKLHLDIKRMEMSYHEQNRREYELTKHVSLMQITPLSLMQLRETGRCTVQLPEEIFDMDGPGHYFRRIKSVAISIPCVAGPYTSVNCTLTLVKSSTRTASTLLDGAYPRDGAEDGRFSDHFGSVQSIVTSSAQNDSGMFETNLRDERYLPFENSGVISEWILTLPANVAKKERPQFDYGTISDVILQIRYTAREGGELLRAGAIKAVSSLGFTRLFSVRHEFPSEWANFKASTPETRELTLRLREDHYPYWTRGRNGGTVEVEHFTRPAAIGIKVDPLPSLTADLTFHLDKADDKKVLDDVLLAVRWTDREA